MHKLVTNGHFWCGPPNLERIKHFNLSFCHNHLLTKTNICAKFERNQWFELYHLLPGFLMYTLLNMFIFIFLLFNLLCKILLTIYNTKLKSSKKLIQFQFTIITNKMLFYNIYSQYVVLLTNKHFLLHTCSTDINCLQDVA